jgi:hypothetical protein
MSAAQMHADAVRESYRNPQPRTAEARTVQPAQRPRLVLRTLLLARL